MLADSGSTVNIIAETDLKNMKHPPKLEKSKSNVYVYGASQSLDVIGRFNTTVKANNRECSANFLVTAGSHGSLLSWNTSVKLNLLQAGNITDVINNVNIDDNNILDLYPELFNGVGTLKGVKIKLHIDPTVTPVAQKFRRAPFHLRKDIEAQIEKDKALGIIEKSEGPTPWVSPVVCVPKQKTGKIRVCVDMRQANKAIKRERHATPTLDELMSDLSGAKVFSKLDLNQGYNQLELAEESRHITTFATHVGLHRYTRLFFGINSAAEVFQDAIRQVLSGLKGTINISDDILVYGSTVQEHNANLKSVLNRLREKGLTLNREKCELNKACVEYFGHMFSAEGISPSPQKIDAILNMESPKSPTELRSFLGLTNYCGSRFIPNYASLTHDLRHLTRKEVPWTWEKKHQDAVQKLKEALSKNIKLNYYSTKRQTEVYVDASPVGLCAILMQCDNDNGTRDIIQLASRALTPTESRYSQTEREALGVVFACEHFDMYVNGTPIKIYTDHKPLTHMFGKNAHKKTLSPRIERWAMRLQPYELTMIYQPGIQNPADYLSRHPQTAPSGDNTRAEKIAEEYVSYIVDALTPKAMSLEIIAAETKKDKTLRAVLEALRTNNWYDARIKEELPLNNLYKTLHKCKDEISMYKDEIILKGSKIVIPETLQQQVVNIAHQGHQGINKTIALLREKVWFKGMYNITEETVRNCNLCLVCTPQTNREPLQMSELPPAPWVEVSADFGQVEEGLYILVIQDEYSRYPVVETVRSTSTKSTIPVLDKVFSEFGIPWQIKTDNGPPFNSDEFAAYMKLMGVQHRRITPQWPQANGETERFMRTIKKVIRGNKRNWKQELYKRLLAYRATPHSTTGVSPASVIFGRDIRTKLPSLILKSNDSDMRERDAMKKRSMKDYADNKQYVKESKLKLGDTVLLKSTGKSKSGTPYDPHPFEVVDKKGNMITAQRGQQVTTRNSSFFKASPKQPQHELPEVKESENYEIQERHEQLEPLVISNKTESDRNRPCLNPPVTPPSTPVARPKRNRNLPIRFKDYMMNGDRN